MKSNQQKDNPQFELGQPVFLKPDLLGNVDIAVFVVIGHSRGFMQGWMAECVAASDPTGPSRFIPEGLLTPDDPYRGMGRVLGYGRTQTGKSLMVIEGGKKAAVEIISFEEDGA